MKDLQCAVPTATSSWFLQVTILYLSLKAISEVDEIVRQSDSVLWMWKDPLKYCGTTICNEEENA